VPLSAGDKLGPYEILAKIGAGGMGEVYRARDTRLRRDVAIKVSAERFSERFDREAHAVAALNHPNICAIYDVGPNYLVMEYVEGEAPQGPMPLEEVLRIAKQITEALGEAHEKGITHRDLKPANIKIKPDGTVKVLDFGLAKVVPTSTSAGLEASPTQSPTMSMAATQAGVILGTAAYMSPEQARGKSVDKRADIWAFGVVLHELITGRKLFSGEDLSDTLAAVIKEEPKLDQVPPKVQRLLKSCLEKDPKNRLRDIADAWKLLDDAPASAPSLSRPGNRVAWITAAAMALIAAAVGFGWWHFTRPVERPLVRLDVDLGQEIALPALNNAFLPSLVISPDGTRLVYQASTAGGQPRLFTRRLDQPKATELPGTTGAIGPFFSPDGQWVGFFAGGKYNKISVEGGAVVPLADAPGNSGASWGEDGGIVIGSTGPNAGLARIPSGGGALTKVTDLVGGELALAQPQILPGGKAVLFTAYPTLSPEKAHIDVVTLANGNRKTLVPGGTSARYLPTSNGTGHLVYTNKGTLFAIPFDPDRLETRGTAVPILDDVAYQALTGAAQFVFAGNGTLVYRKSGGAASSSMSTLQWLDATGKKEPLRAKAGDYSFPHLSPDGKRVAMVVSEGSNQDVWVYDQQRDATTRLTFGGGAYIDPVWSPDGRYVFIGSIGGGMFWTRADGAGQPQPLTQTKTFQVPWSFTPDGKRLAYFEISGAPQLSTVTLEEANGQMKAGKPEQFLKSQFQDVTPEFSPDGRWLAYMSNATGANEVYVRAFPPPASGQGGQWQISNSGGVYPMWSRTGHDLLYQSGDQIMAASYTVNGDSFVAEKPRVWLAKVGGGTAFGLALDGKRVAVTAPVETPEAPKADHEVVFLENFFDYLRQRVPLPK
jgi:Tol biopolymer transport system component